MALKGVKVIELAGLAPAPYCGMILQDFGASVTRIDRVKTSFTVDALARGKRSVAVDLKQKRGAEVLKKLCSSADVLIEPFRTGVMEKLGLGPEVLMKDNSKLIYARLTGFGQSGPFSSMAGHDINYMAISGVLSMLGRKEENPLPPINLLADFAGGGLLCSLGVVMALFERTHSGKGQVIDASMVEGSAYIGSWLYRSRDSVMWGNPRGENILDSGYHFYETYKTKDGKYIAVGALEPQFYSCLLEGLGFSEAEVNQQDTENGKKMFTERFLERTQEEWCKIFDGTDACVTPVLSIDEAPCHPHNQSRTSFVKSSSGQYEPNPAPLLSRTPGKASLKDPDVGQHTEEVLLEEGFSPVEILQLNKVGTIEVKKPKEAKL